MIQPTYSNLLSMRDVSKRFGPTVALDGVDLTLKQGEILALIGENGAGKSTLMKVLSGAHPPDRGQMQLAGQPYMPRNPMDARQARVAMIYQELSIAPDLTVMENIMLGVEPMRTPACLGIIDWPKMRSVAKQALEQIGHPEIAPDACAGDLPIAQQQLVEIARSIALGCKVLVLDEPTSSLAKQDIDKLFAMLDQLRKQGLGMIYISHFLEEVRQISDRFTVLRDGASVGEGITAQSDNAQIIRMMVGRDVRDLYPRSTHIAGEALLELKAVAGNTKPKRASLTLHRGEVLGIAGLVGAGRTEMLRAIFGLDAIQSGQVRLATYSGHATPAKRWAQSAGMVSEDRKTEGLALGLSIADNTTLSDLKGLGPMGLVLPSRQQQATLPWIQKLKLKCESPAQAVEALSGGNQQKVAIARLLHHDVDLLLLDEPTRGVDIGSKAQIYQLIDELALGDGSRKPRAILLVSSYLPELLGVCDRIAVMSRGVLGEARDVSQWTEHELMMEATGQA